MARRQRQFTTFNLSFLDIMSCGFGAVVLVFLIMNHAIEQQTMELNENLLSEVNLLDEDVSEGEAGLVRLRNTLSDVDLQIVAAQGLATRIMEEQESWEARIADLRNDGYTDNSDIAALKADIQSLEEEVKKLRAASAENTGSKARAFIGAGNRQYLTGLNLGGKHIAILLDMSSSMLAEKLVQIIRLRNMSPDVQRGADKWTRSMSTVDWLTAQLPIGAKYQVILFNTKARAAVPGTEGKWLEVADQAGLDKLSQELRKVTPSGGTSMQNAFTSLRQLTPAPDNIFLITDGLPTQGATAPSGTKVSGKERRKLFRRAVEQLPRGVPVNIVLAPMEGDPWAAADLWQLAQATQGSFLSPSRDWP